MSLRKDESFERCVELVRALDAPPVAIEACWDWDFESFWVILSCITEKPSADHPRFTDHPLTWFGDREIAAACALGTRLSEALGVPFHFPDRAAPDDPPRWWTAHAEPLVPRPWQVTWTADVDVGESAGDKVSYAGTLVHTSSTPGEALHKAIAIGSAHGRTEDEYGRVVHAETQVGGQTVAWKVGVVQRLRCSPAGVALLRDLAFQGGSVASAFRTLAREHAVNLHDIEILVDEHYRINFHQRTVIMDWSRGWASDEKLEEELRPVLVPAAWKGD